MEIHFCVHIDIDKIYICYWKKKATSVHCFRVADLSKSTYREGACTRGVQYVMETGQ